MISLAYSEIPQHLQDGDFYRSLCKCDTNCVFEIPSECFYQKDKLETLQDFTNLLKSTAYWGLDNIPTGLIHFCFNHIFLLWGRVVDDGFSDVLFARNLRSIFCTLSGSEESLIKSIEMGSTQIVEFLVKRVNSSVRTAASAAECGRKDYLQLLRDHGHKWDETACTAAAKAGHLDCLQYLFENGCHWNGKVLIAACANGHRDCMEYALKNGMPWPIRMVCTLVRRGDIELFTFAVRHSFGFTDSATYFAAANGNIPCLQWFLENGIPANEKACAVASYAGQLESLKFLRAHNIPWDATAPQQAAWYGHFDCLQYLHTNGCPWDTETTRLAVIGGNNPCLRYALEHGCPYNEFLIKVAVCGRVSCLRYLVEEQNVYLDKDGSVFFKAFVVANHKAVQYLLDIGCPYQTDMIDESKFTLSKFFCEGEGADFDGKLLKCIKIAHNYQWNMLRRGSVITNRIKAEKNTMPLCWRYLIEEVFVFYD